MTTLIRLYPQAWRTRYGAELEDLITLRPLGLGGSIDLIRGALDAHRHPELVDPAAALPWADPETVSPRRLADLRYARRLGMASWIGAAFWLAGWVIAMNGPIVVDAGGSYRDGAAGAPFVIIAMLLLAAGLMGQMIRLPHSARIARIGAVVALITGPVWGLGPWILPFGVLALAGIVVLAVGSWWAKQWRWPSTAAVVGSALAGVIIVVVAMMGSGGDRMAMVDLMFVAIVVFTPIWLVVGGTLRSLPPVDETSIDAAGASAEPAGS